MLRSEAIASSRIEGMQAFAAQIALAELAPTDAPEARGFTRNARFIANNITALRKAATDLADAPAVCVDGIDDQAERRLASTRWDTRKSPPARPAPAPPRPR